MTVKELLQLRRDWRTALALLGMPIVLLLIYGFALSFDVKDIRLVVVDQSRGRAAREITEAFLRSGYFVRVATLDETRPLEQLFDSGRAQAALVIPASFGSDVAVRRPTSLQFVLDGSDSQTASTILGYARQIVASAGMQLVGMRARPAIEAAPLVWYNPDLASSLFLVPGLVAFILMVTSVTPATSATSRCVLLALHSIEDMYIAAAATPVGPRPDVSSFLAASPNISIAFVCTSPLSFNSLQNLEM